MQKIARFTPEERENLTAYLDGELDERHAAEIEQKLTRSEVARREVDILARTWDMLNLLPRVNVSPEFSRKTLSIAQQQEQPQLLNRSKAWLHKGRRIACLLVWAGGLGLAGLAGFQITNRIVPDESRMLVEDFPVIDNLDSYREVGEIEFLQQLKTARVFQEEPVDAP